MAKAQLQVLSDAEAVTNTDYSLLMSHCSIVVARGIFDLPGLGFLRVSSYLFVRASLYQMCVG